MERRRKGIEREESYRGRDQRRDREGGNKQFVEEEREG